MFERRSNKKELLDKSDIDKRLLYQNLKELETVNKYLGGHAVSLKGLGMILNGNAKTHSVVDIGCGGGDSLKTIANWLKRKGNSIHLTGIDLKQDCIDYARNNCNGCADISFQCNDFRTVFSEQNKPDIIHASLFFHHFTEDEIISFLDSCNKQGIIAVINDLERHPIAYYSIKILTNFFSKSPLVKNDAPLSVLRGFKKKEWVEMLQKAGVKRYSVQNCWAFRHLTIAYPNGN